MVKPTYSRYARMQKSTTISTIRRLETLLNQQNFPQCNMPIDLALTDAELNKHKNREELALMAMEMHRLVGIENVR